VNSPMSFVKNLGPRKSTEPRVNPAVAAHTPSGDFVPSDTKELAEGEKVEHMKFGFGVVTKMEINGTDRKATVKFDTVGEKTLLLSFAKLRIIK